MLTITLTRNKGQMGKYGTFGKIDANGFKSNTMEPSPTAEHPCIPKGSYVCKLGVSPHFWETHTDYGFGRGVVYHVQNVPNRSHILIHAANWPSQLQGCIALGSAVYGKEGYMGILSSKPAVKAFMEAMKGQDFILNIIEE